MDIANSQAEGDCCQPFKKFEDMTDAEKLKDLALKFRILEDKFNVIQHDLRLMRKHHHHPRSGDIMFTQEDVESRLRWERFENRIASY